MSTRARTSNRQAAQYTEIWIVGTPAQIAILLRAAQQTGALVYASAPTVMGPDDLRHRRYLRMRTS